MLFRPPREPVLPAPGELLDLGLEARRCVPVRALPSADITEIGARRDQPVVDRRGLHAARGHRRHGRVVALVDHAERLDGALAAILRIGLVLVQAVDVDAGHIGVGRAVDDPVRKQAADAAAGEDADRIQPSGDEVILELGRFADDRAQVGREALRTAEEFLDPGFERDRNAAHRLFQIGRHAIPIGWNLAEGEILRNSVDMPWRADRLEQADQQAADFLAEVAVGRRVFEHRHRRREARDRLGDQVVVLGRLVRDGDAVALAELARPHACAVDHILRLDIARLRAHAGDPAVLLQHAGDAHALDQARACHARAPGERHGHVHRIGAAVIGDIEAGENVVDARERKQRLHLRRRNLLHVDAAPAVEGGDPAILFEAVGVGGDLDEPDRIESGGLAGLRFQAAIEIAGVFPQLGRRLGGGAESDDQPGRVPRRARGEPIALQQHDVLPAHVRQVIGDRRPDDAAAHHNHTCAIRQHRSSHRQNPRSGGQFTCILSTLKRNRRPFALCRYPSARDRSREANILRGMASPSRQVKGAERR